MKKYELKNLIKQCLLEIAKGKNNNIPDETEGRMEKLIQAYRKNRNNIPDETEGRIEKLIQAYRKNGSKGDLDLGDMNLTKFPDVLKYVDVGGGFSCANNQLKSLKGAPKSVRGSFYCTNNQLKSLEGAPKNIGGDFYCGNNAVKFTEEQVRSFCDVKGKIIV
jgi:hypothetical protein